MFLGKITLLLKKAASPRQMESCWIKQIPVIRHTDLKKCVVYNKMLGFIIFLLIEEMTALDEESEELNEEQDEILLNSILEESKKKELSYNEIRHIISEFNSSKLCECS